MATSVFENEKRMQKVFKMRNRPERFTNKENAISFANHCTKSQMIVYLDENPDGFIPGYYVVYPCDYSRLEREAEEIFKHVHFTDAVYKPYNN
jgi:hypothetical protein